MSRPRQRDSVRPMPRYLLHHRHGAHECGVVFAAFAGHDSTLRHNAAIATCAFGGHEIWWTVDAPNAQDALELLPIYVAQRTIASHVSDVLIP
jgi:hypothetical protein